jgi:hypothetical protein
MAFPMKASSRTAPAPDRPATRAVGPGLWVWLPLGLLTLIALIGIPYYVAPVADRLRHPFHVWLRPSGYIGQTAGLVTFAGFLFMWLFPLRKRLRKVEWLGPVPRWLDVHIGVGLVLPLLGGIHAGFRVGGVIGLGYIAMLIVCASGFVGRYLYVRIPRTRSGVEMGLSEVAAHQRSLLAEIAEATGLTVVDVQDILRVEGAPGRLGIAQAFVQMVRDDLARGRAVRRLRHRLIVRGGSSAAGLKKVATLARREMALSQHARLLDATQAIFRHWHAAHRPFAITAFIAVTIHVVVVIAVGATWF